MLTITAGDRPMTVINVFTVAAAQQAHLVELLTQATESSIRQIPGFYEVTQVFNPDASRPAV